MRGGKSQMKAKVILYGMGQMNKLAARLLTEKGIEIVGAIYRSDNPTEVLSKEADIVIVAVSSDLPTMFPIYKECLEAGKNVATIGESSSYSWRVHPKLTGELDSIARSKGVTLTGTGAQDFGIVHLGVLMSSACHKIDQIIYRNCFDPTLFGKETLATLTQSPSIYVTFWENVASALNLNIVDIDESINASQTILDIKTKEGIRMLGEYKLIVGEEFKAWEIKGQPNLSVKVDGLGSPVVTAAQTINRLSHIIEAPAGYITIEKLPMAKYQI